MNDVNVTVYLSGPMRGIPEFNFPAFNEAADRLRTLGYTVLNPAETPYNGEDFHWYMRHDIPMVLKSDMVAVLPGWEKSEGANVEVTVARAIGIPVVDAYTMNHIEHPNPVGPGNDEDVLKEALRLTTCDRQNSYGPPTQDFSRTAAMWSAIKGVAFEPREVAMFMIALKLSRETHQKKRDNAVDIAGYARLLHLCNTAQ